LSAGQPRRPPDGGAGCGAAWRRARGARAGAGSVPRRGVSSPAFGRGCSHGRRTCGYAFGFLVCLFAALWGAPPRPLPSRPRLQPGGPCASSTRTGCSTRMRWRPGGALRPSVPPAVGRRTGRRGRGGVSPQGGRFSKPAPRKGFRCRMTGGLPVGVPPAEGWGEIPRRGTDPYRQQAHRTAPGRAGHLQARPAVGDTPPPAGSRPTGPRGTEARPAVGDTADRPPGRKGVRHADVPLAPRERYGILPLRSRVTATQAPARCPATLRPWRGAPGDDRAVSSKAYGKRGKREPPHEQANALGRSAPSSHPSLFTV
jgi:hypothetical protein